MPRNDRRASYARKKQKGLPGGPGQGPRPGKSQCMRSSNNSQDGQNRERAPRRPAAKPAGKSPMPRNNSKDQERGVPTMGDEGKDRLSDSPKDEPGIALGTLVSMSDNTAA